MKKKIIILIMLFILLILLLIIIFKKPSEATIDNNDINNDNHDKPLNINIVEKKNNNMISKNDLIKIGDTEEFYVIDSNSEKTVLIAKNNLYVGAVYSKYDEKTGKFTLEKTISSSEKGYCLQNKDAIGNLSKDKETIGGVYFSSKSYWTDSGNKLLNKYGTYENKDYGWTKNNIYDKVYNGIDDTNYSIAYFIELYIKKIKEFSSANINGRLLTFEELDNLNCHLTNTLVNCDEAPEYIKSSSFYISAAYNDTFVYTNKYEIIPYNGNNRSPYYKGSYLEFDSEQPTYSLAGVRPVIIVNTKDIK